MKQRPIVRGTLILTAGGLITRVIGAVYRILLVRLIGAEGLGLHQLPFPLFLLGISIATLGLPVGLSALVADLAARGQHAEARRMRSLALRLSMLGGTLVATTIFVLAPTLALHILSDERAVPVVRAMSIALFFSCMSGSLRGYFHGLQDMVPSASSQIVEQIVRSFSALALAWWLLPRGIAWAAAGAMAGVALGEVASLVTLFTWTTTRELPGASPPVPTQTSQPDANNSKRLLQLSIPLAFTRTMHSLGRTAEVALIPRRLASMGLDRAATTATYGQLTGIALPLLFLPTVFIFPLSTALLPAVATTAVRNPHQLRRQVLTLTGLALGIGLAASGVFYLLADWLAGTLYGVITAAPLIALLSVAAPPAYVEFVSTSVLNGLGQTRLVFEHSLAGALVRLALIQLLVGNPAFGAGGVIWAFAAGEALTALLNLGSLVPLLSQQSPNGH